MPILGEIRMFGGTYAPRGWVTCDGQLLPISAYEALYAVIGTTFGGDGQATFGVPDYRGRAPMNWGQGKGLSNYAIGQPSGAEQITVLVTQMATHNHTLQLLCNADPAKTTLRNGLNAFPGPTSAPAYANAASGVMAAQPGAGGITGGSQPHDNMQPFLTVTFIMATEGIFPSHN